VAKIFRQENDSILERDCALDLTDLHLSVWEVGVEAVSRLDTGYNSQIEPLAWPGHRPRRIGRKLAEAEAVLRAWPATLNHREYKNPMSVRVCWQFVTTALWTCPSWVDADDDVVPREALAGHSMNGEIMATRSWDTSFAAYALDSQAPEPRERSSRHVNAETSVFTYQFSAILQTDPPTFKSSNLYL